MKICYAIMPSKKGRVDIDTLWDIHDWKLLEIIHQDTKGVSLMTYYLIEYLDEILFFEFTEMLKNGKCVKRCKLCGRYFVLTDKRKRDFCDRPYKGKRTCKQVGGKLFFEKGLAADKFYSSTSPSTTRSIPAGTEQQESFQRNTAAWI